MSTVGLPLHHTSMLNRVNKLFIVVSPALHRNYLLDKMIQKLQINNN